MEAETKQCAKCGKSFSCFANTGKKCWCEDLKIPEQALELLKREFKDCLCPECLPVRSPTAMSAN